MRAPLIVAVMLAFFVNPGSAQEPAKSTIKAFAAVIDVAGNVVRGHAGTNAAHPMTGTYQVYFSKSVAGCVFDATLGTTGSAGIVPPGFITVAGDTHNARAIYVQTFNAAAVLTDSSFHLLASC